MKSEHLRRTGNGALATRRAARVAAAVALASAFALPWAAAPAGALALDPGSGTVLGATSASASASAPWGGPATAPAGLVRPAAASPEESVPAYGRYEWPVRGPVVRPFEPPATPYGRGHRGIDIAVPFGTPIRAPADGTVSFAGPVAGSLFISIDHPDGVRTSYSWISEISVTEGQAVQTGSVIGRTGRGDPGSPQPVLHFSARIGGVYFDPMLLLGGGNLDQIIRLAEVES